MFKKWMGWVLAVCLILGGLQGVAAAETSTIEVDGEESGSNVLVMDYFCPTIFAEMYNTLISTFLDQYYADLDTETLAGMEKNLVLTTMDVNAPILYLDSDSYGIEASFRYADDTEFTESDSAQLWNFAINRYLADEEINLAAYTLKMMIAYNYQDAISIDTLNEWFNLLDTNTALEFPGYTLYFLLSDDYIHYAMLPTIAQTSAE